MFGVSLSFSVCVLCVFVFSVCDCVFVFCACVSVFLLVYVFGVSLCFSVCVCVCASVFCVCMCWWVSLCVLFHQINIRSTGPTFNRFILRIVPSKYLYYSISGSFMLFNPLKTKIL